MARIPSGYRRAGLLATAAGASVALSVLVRLSIDERYSLAWGAEIAGGDLPDVEDPLQSTPHPLPILLGVLLSPLGPRGAADGWAVAAAASWLLLLYAGWRLARALVASPGARRPALAAGILAVALLATRERIGFFALNAFVDVPFAALCVLAAAVLAERGRGGLRTALVLLAVAGLLRPEAWGAAVGLAAWAAWRWGDRSAAVWALALAAPVVWIGQDLLLAGDPLHSLTHTQEGADRLGRETGVLRAPIELAEGLGRLAGVPVAAFGAALLVARARTWWPAAALAAAFGLVFLALGVLDLPLNDRYLVPVGVALVAAAAVGTTASESGLERVLGLAAVVGSLVLLPWEIPDLADRVARAGDRRAEDAQLERLVESDEAERALERCGRVTTPFESRALVAHLTERDPANVEVAASGSGDGAVHFADPRGRWEFSAAC